MPADPIDPTALLAELKQHAPIPADIESDQHVCGTCDLPWWPCDAARAAELIEHQRAERDTLAEALERIRKAFRHLCSSLIAVSDRLREPYTDAPDCTPWSQFVLPRMVALRTAINAAGGQAQPELDEEARRG